MASTTVYCKRSDEMTYQKPARRPLMFLIILLLPSCLLIANGTQANSSQPEAGQIDISYLNDYHHDQQLKVDADVGITLPQPMLDALHHEIPLTFITQFELDERFNFMGINLNRTRTQIKYKTKLYYFTYNNLYFITNLRNRQTQSFENLKDALKTLGTIDNFNITDLSELHPSTLYTIKLRVKFDPWELPSPLLIHTLISRDWYLSSGWHKIEIRSPSSWY